MNSYKLSYNVSKKRINDLIHKGLEYEKEHNIAQPEKETIRTLKDHRIKVLERALELACSNSNFQQTCDFCEYREYSGSGDCPCYCETEQGFEQRQAINYFKQQAEREVKLDKEFSEDLLGEKD